jgi:hypothetical protein
VATLGLILSRPSLESPRPTPVATDGKPITAGNNVPARLWQDPLTPVLRGQKPKEDIAAVVNHGPELSQEHPDKEAKVLFLFDFIGQEDTPEAAETRRRERYAVLSALNTSGYVPTHPDRIYSATLPCKGRPDVSAAGDGQGRRAADPSEDESRIPYEWVQLPKEQRDVQCSPYYQAVCVIWVSPRPDSKKQLHLLVCLSDLLKKSLVKRECKFAIVGRIGSTQLDAILQEDGPSPDFTDCVTLYVTSSTAPSVRRKPKDPKLKLEYIIDTDQFLAEKLIYELQLRRINLEKSGSLAVIAEWDTDYGREMHKVFEHATSGQANHVRHYSYLRGLDGKELGGASGDQTRTPPDSGGEAGSGPKSTARKPTAKEGEGEPQIDYLRRLAQRMKEEETQYNYHLRAIGIVGNDVYDKLLLLRALRPVFPNAVFFTTDLDVRLLQPGNYSDTRNLLIASHYGLSLNRCLQGGVAPFRSSYDTASYLGCLRAVKYPPLQTQEENNTTAVVQIKPDDPNGGLLVPTVNGDRMPVHLYEVGRSGAYELTLRADDQLGPPNPRCKPWFTEGPRLLYFLGLALVASVLLYPVSRPWQRSLQAVAARARALRGPEERGGARDGFSAVAAIPAGGNRACARALRGP